MVIRVGVATLRATCRVFHKVSERENRGKESPTFQSDRDCYLAEVKAQ